MGLCAPAVVAANAALEGSTADDGFVIVPGQFIEMAGVFQFMGRVGQRREGHTVPCKADARDTAGDRCVVHAGTAAALLRIDGAVLGKVLPDIVAPRAHFAPGSAVGGGFPGAKTQVGDFCQLPAQREEQPELRQLRLFALPCHRNVAAAYAVNGKINGQRLPIRQGVVCTNCDKTTLCFGGQVITPGIQSGSLPEGKRERLCTALDVVGGDTPEVGAHGIIQQLHTVIANGHKPLAAAENILETLALHADVAVHLYQLRSGQGQPGGDNPSAKSQGMKQLMAGGGVALVGITLIPLLSGLFG